jgi:hypothetical protein
VGSPEPHARAAGDGVDGPIGGYSGGHRIRRRDGVLLGVFPEPWTDAQRDDYLARFYNSLLLGGVDAIKAGELAEQEFCVLHVAEGLLSGELTLGAPTKVK